MNKKRIALALAAGLSLNALVVTVAPIGGQATVAHATQSRVVPGTENEKKVNAIDIKTLETTVVSYDGNGTLNLKINKDNVKDIKGTLNFAKFTERNNSTDSNASVNVTWNSTSKTVEIKNVNGAGIYSGDVTITYNDNTTETYKLTFRKTYVNDKLTLEGVEVLPAAISFTNIKLGANVPTISADAKVELKLGSTVVDTITDLTDKAFTVKDLKEGQVYDVVYSVKEGNQFVEKGRTQVKIVKEDNVTVSAVATNDIAKSFTYTNSTTAPTTVASLESEIKANYGGTGITLEAKAGTTAGEFLVDVKNGTSVVDTLKFKQDLYSTSKPYGGVLTLTDNTNGELKVELGAVNTTSATDNAVPTLQIISENGTNKTASTLVGYYTIDINGSLSTYLNATSGVTTKAEISTNDVILSMVGGTTVTTGTNSNIMNGKTFSTVVNNLSHGYQVIPVVFDVNTNAGVVGTETLPTLQAKLDTLAGQNSGKTANKLKVTDVEADLPDTPVNTSIIVAKDEFDAMMLDVKFEKNTEKEGIFTIVGGKSLVTNQNDLINITNNLKVSNNGVNGNVIYSNTNGNDLEFKVSFDKPMTGNVDWNYDGFNGTIEFSTVDALNFNGQVTTSNQGSEKLENDFYIKAQLNSMIPSGTATKLNGNNVSVDFNNGQALVNLKTLVAGSYTVDAEITDVTQKYRGKYSAGLIVSTQPMGLKVEATSTVNNRIDVNVDADFFVKDDTKNVTNAKLVYNKVGETKTTEISLKDQVKEDKVPVTLTVDAGKYEVRAIYDYTVNGKTTPVVSNVVTVEVKGNTNTGNTNNGSGIVSGGSGSTTTGTSVGSTTVTVNSNNSTTSSGAISVTVPTGANVDTNRTPVPVRFTYKGTDGKTVTESKEQYSVVTATFNGDKIELKGLVPGKEYTEISVDYTDRNGSTRTLILKDVRTTATSDVEKYLADVYTTVFNRPADEAGYHFHLNNLKDKKVSLRDFLKNMLNEKEFNENYKTPEAKVEALYAAIVARTPDQAGKDFWVAEYKKAVTTYGSEALALQAIVDRMVNEPELKTLAEKMNVQW